MSDVTVTFSRYRITYEPADGGPEVVLLDWGDLMSAHPQFDGGPTTQTDEIIESAWVACHSRGNVHLQLSWDHYGRGADLATAQATGLGRFFFLLTHPEGLLRIQTGWRDDGVPLFDWTFRATLESCTPSELDEETSPFADAAAVLVAYQFTIFNPTDNNDNER